MNCLSKPRPKNSCLVSKEIINSITNGGFFYFHNSSIIRHWVLSSKLPLQQPRGSKKRKPGATKKAIRNPIVLVSALSASSTIGFAKDPLKVKDRILFINPLLFSLQLGTQPGSSRSRKPTGSWTRIREAVLSLGPPLCLSACRGSLLSAGAKRPRHFIVG